MKKLINKPSNVVAEMLVSILKEAKNSYFQEGVVLIQQNVKLITDMNVIVRADIDNFKDQQVSIISGGGSGHEPSHAGLVGEGMLSAAVCGEVFSSPSWAQIYAAIKAVGGKKGVLFIVKNYMGDIMNFNVAKGFAEKEGIQCEIVIVADDVALLETVEPKRARGIAGTVLVHKVAGYLCKQGLDLQEVAEQVRIFASSVKSMGVALSPCTIPAVGQPSFQLGSSEMAFGLGIHGEAGWKIKENMTADNAVDQILDLVLPHVKFDENKSAVVLLNNLGSTTNMEMAIIARRVSEYFEAKSLKISYLICGALMTSLEMAGFSVSVTNSTPELVEMLDAPVPVTAWVRGTKPPSSVKQNILPPQAPSILGRDAQETSQFVKRVIKDVCEKLIKEKDVLTDLDLKTGDGDMGVNVQKACEFVLSELPNYPCNNNQTLFNNLTYGLRYYGGSSGAFFSTFFSKFADVFADPSMDSDPATWVKALKEGIEGISALGGAKEGQKTMLDAFYPTLRGLESGLHSGASPSELLKLAAKAAEEGALATEALQSKAGRSEYAGEKSKGHKDPGAAAVAIVFGELATERK